MNPNHSNNFCCGGGGGFLQSGYKDARWADSGYRSWLLHSRMP
jgi:Fe-S oxidoreductase